MNFLRWSWPALFVFAACSAKIPAPSAFKGTWTVSHENGLTGSTISETIHVEADQKFFRLITRGRDNQTTEIYDGQNLMTQFVSFPSAVNVFSSLPPPEASGTDVLPEGSSSPLNTQSLPDAAVARMRFWAQPFRGRSSDGGAVAGRNTVIYEINSRQANGQLTLKRWVDPKSGITLKSVESLFSPTANAVITRVIRECRQIDFGPVDSSIFTAP